MGKLFSSPPKFNFEQKTSSKNTLSFFHKQFALSVDKKKLGNIVKILLSNKENSLATIQEEIFKTLITPNKNCLFIGTTPTVRYSKDFLMSIYPGHNFSFMTDSSGQVSVSISKRPDTNKPLMEQKRVPDKRFKEQPSVVKLFEPHYTTPKEDVMKWLERAQLVSSYPLYFHIVPLIPGLAFDPKQYKTNVHSIVEERRPYSLFSWIHPHGRFIRASNCNSDVEKAIFGEDNLEVQDMSCQEAVIAMVAKLANPTATDYLEAAKTLGLNDGIEKSSITSEDYMSSFTA